MLVGLDIDELEGYPVDVDQMNPLQARPPVTLRR